MNIFETRVRKGGSSSAYVVCSSAMFFLDPASLACCIATCCCGTGSVCLYKRRKEIPHPSECALVGKAYRLCGCHDHDKFDLSVEIHEILNVPASGRYCVVVEVGRSTVKTAPAEAIKGRVDIQERGRLHIRQADSELVVRVWKQVVVKTDEIGEVSINVKTDLIDAGFPKRQWFFCMKEGKTTCKVLLSFHRLETDKVHLGDFQMSPLLHQALLQAQYEAEARGETLRLDLAEMSDVERLRLLSKVIEGPLQQMRSIGGSWRSLYFRAVERSSGKWEWQYWNSKDDCLGGVKKEGAYSFLAISLVLPDRHDRQCFYVRYHDSAGVHDLFFRRVDRDRNLWSDGLFEFIEKLRDYIEKHPQLVMERAEPTTRNRTSSSKLEKSESAEEDVSGRRQQQKEGDVGGSKTPRKKTSSSRRRRRFSNSPRVSDATSRARSWERNSNSSSALRGRSPGAPVFGDEEMKEKRRLLSPRKTAADESVRPRVPVLKERMAYGLMYHSDSVDNVKVLTRNSATGSPTTAEEQTL